MSGTKAGGVKAAQTNKERYGKDFYKQIAKESAKAWERNGKKPKGFAAYHELAPIAGKKGGAITKRKDALQT